MDLTALKSELSTDPLALGYAKHMPDAPGSVVDLLSAPTQSMVKPITAASALAWAADGPYGAIVDAGKDTTSPYRSSCLALRDAILSGMLIHVEDATMQALFSAWIAGNIITQAQHDALIARATQPACRAEVLGIAPVTIDEVIAAWQQ